MSENSFKAQAAFEFLISYSWAILVITIVLISFLVIINIPKTAVPNSCVFSSGVQCRGILIGTNTLSGSTRINLLIVNGQQYDLINPSAYINVSSYGSITTACTPTNAIAGSAILCTALLPRAIPVTYPVTGGILVNASICLIGSFNNCQAQQVVSYIGNFSQNVGTYTGAFPATISLTVPANAVRVGTPTQVVANVKLLGLAVEGATVTFSASSTNTIIYPQYALTDPTGNATGIFTSSGLGNYIITANSFGQIATNTLSVVTYT